MFRIFRSNARKPARTRLKLESFESRIVPAAVVHFFEADGDKITVRTNKGTNAQLLSTLAGNVAITEGATGVTDFHLNLITNASTSAAFAGTNLSISAAKSKGLGNGLVNFVYIDAYNSNDALSIDLGKVAVKGRLVYLDAGNADLITPAVVAINVTEWGPDIGSTGAIFSEICGNITSIKVSTDFNGWIISKDTAGAANYLSAGGTVIGSFTAKNFSSADGASNGRLQIRTISKLKIKETFGVAGAAADRGLIEAHSITKMSIKAMAGNATIRLA